MSIVRTSVFVLALGAGIAITTAAEAAPRILFRGCSFYGMPGCMLMRATDGKVYQLLDLDPAFPPNRPVLVYANPGPSPGICFAPTAKVKRWKLGKSC
jgi:hypothetical protein